MKYLKYLILPVLGILMIAAIPSNKKITKVDKDESFDIEIKLDIDSFQLLKNNCLICHGTGSSHDNMLAPPMHAVKNHYWTTETTEKEFVNDIANWVHNPNMDNMQMPGAVNKFNIMPKIVVADEDLKTIATYLFNNDIEKPNWCSSNEMPGMNKGKSGLQRGKCNQKQMGSTCCNNNKTKGCNNKTYQNGCNHGPKNKKCKTK